MKTRQYQRSRGEKGQILILIVLGFIVIIGFAALAIDGGLLFSDRRAAQNAADAAALSAAFAKCEENDFVAAAEKIAANNGFVDNGDDVRVMINNPPASGPYGTNLDYIEVIIKVVRKPVFAGFVSQTPLENTVRAVAHCHLGGGGGDTEPGLGGEVSLLALNKTASRAITNTGGATIIVDGGVFVNSTANDAFYQTGSAMMQMNWAKIRGGAAVEGGLGINVGGTGTIAQQIDVVKDFRTSGWGKAIAGAFNIGGNVVNSASVTMTGNPMNVGGSFDNSGSGIITANPLVVGGNIINRASGIFTSQQMVVGGSIVADGDTTFNAPSEKTLNMQVKGNIDLSGSAKINGNVTMEGNYTHSGAGVINGNLTKSSVLKPTFSVTIPEMADPLAALVNPPVPPSGSCTNLTIPNWGTYNPPMTTGGYYCDLNIGGSVVSTIPPGTYWVNGFVLGGEARLTMDGVHLYITGKNKTTAFNVGGSAKTSMIGTMIYIKSGAFTVDGYGGTFAWTAPGSGDYQGMALYMDRANAYAASQTGSAFISTETGTWYAPLSKCSFTGNTPTTVYAQFICDTVTVTGSSNLKIKYDSTLIYQVSTSGGASEVSLDE